VHHSDRRSQYASKDYTDLLKTNQIDISISRKGHNPGTAKAAKKRSNLSLRIIPEHPLSTFSDP
jgi:transposase InsO family protein